MFEWSRRFERDSNETPNAITKNRRIDETNQNSYKNISYFKRCRTTDQPREIYLKNDSDTEVNTKKKEKMNNARRSERRMIRTLSMLPAPGPRAFFRIIALESRVRCESIDCKRWGELFNDSSTVALKAFYAIDLCQKGGTPRETWSSASIAIQIRNSWEERRPASYKLILHEIAGCNICIVGGNSHCFASLKRLH